MVLECLIHTFFRPMRCCLLCLLCATRLAFFTSMHSYCMLAYMFMHESLLVSSILQSNGGMDTRSKPTYVLLGHPLLFDSMLFALFTCLACFVCLRWALLVSVFFACSPYFPCFFLCLSADLFLLSLHVHAWSTGTWSKGATS